MKPTTPAAYELPIYWFPVYNQESETCPPGAVVEVKSIDTSNGYAKIGKPSADGTGAVFFNSLAAIPAGGRGECTGTLPATAAYQANNLTATDPAHDEAWGVVSGSWFLHFGYAGFRIVGAGGYGLCNVQRSNWQDDLKLLPSYDAGAVQFLYHDDSGVLDWFDAEECP